MNSPRVKPIGFEAWGPSGFQMMIVKTQCQATTTSRLKARTKSMKRSRSPTGGRGGEMLVAAEPLVPSAVMAEARPWWPIAAIVTALVVVNVGMNRVATDIGYVPWAVTWSVALVWFARKVDGRSWTDLGMARSDLRTGLAWGGVLAGTILVAYLLGMAIPGTRELFRDERVRGWSFGHTAYAAFLRVPLGTVLIEEVAFRAVLPAVLVARWSRGVAVAVSALLFGFWHLLPAMGISDVNETVSKTAGTVPGWVTVVGAVASTTAVGAWFWWLRDRSGSVLTPMLLHWSTNGLGYLFAYVAWR